MRVSLVLPEEPASNYFRQVPIGLLYTAARLRGEGHAVELFDLRAEGTYADAGPSVAESDLVVVATNDYDLAQCYPSIAPAQVAVATLAEATDAPVVCVGSHGTVAPEATLSATGAHAALRGEFEFVVPEYVRAGAAGGAFPAGGWPAAGPRNATEAELAELPLPAYDLAPMSRYYAEGFGPNGIELVPSGLVLGNRGCPYACSFCYLHFGRAVRRRPVARIVDEAEAQVRGHGLRNLFFLDYTFTLDARWVDEFCAEMAARDLDASWLCQTRCDRVAPELLASMRAAGCAGVWLGVESPVPEHRALLGKAALDDGRVNAAVEMVRAAGLECLLFVMVGLPGESQESLAALTHWLDSQDVHYALSVLTPRPGTQLATGTADEFAASGWAGLGGDDSLLGMSSLPLDEIGWFFEHHAASRRRAANAPRPGARSLA